ncbi:EamA family transporter RarD [Phascolarctobacterium sp. ET69]|uniref:EamA family transporter RarD n=1 Tax=Phascolarctobacterium sp. ET69 TaxID=2939420 RepID=UPI0020128355|nr:EamA family transporter RarD [Phascolarctobacterium sp. ET69]MCL1605379.1 EamA family transporter RarD [Phascolarctobacterium sp. ET69]
MENYKQGIFFGLAAYVLWGILPVYWKALELVSPFEILSSRFMWSCVFVFLLIIFQKKWPLFAKEVKQVFSNVKTGAAMVAAGITISFNWGTFIWAVNNGHIVETSMGYYINPLVSILFAVVFLRERLDKMQLAAITCAFIGVASMVYSFGKIPWVSLTLAFTFALYGLLKKILPVSALTSIMLETLLITPLALVYEYSLWQQGVSFYASGNLQVIMMLTGAGVVTAIPLLLFTAGARMLPLKIIGFLQYISPTLTLLIGVFVYNEAFTASHLLAFGWIWAALLLFIVSQLRSN